jgi:hypothetical protein
MCALILCGCRKQQQSGVLNAAYSSESLPPFQLPRLFTPRSTLKTTDATSNEYIREWNWFTTVGDYQRFGRTNPAWDAEAIEAMERYCDARVVNRAGAALDDFQKRSGEAAAKAIAEHCDDPLVKYIHIRLVLSRQPGATAAKLGELFANCADEFEKTEYSPVRKMYADLRAADLVDEALGRGTNIPPRLTALRRAMVQHLDEALHDRRMPPREAADITGQVWEVGQYSGAARFEMEKGLIPTLQSHWSNQAFSHLICGKYYIDKAWRIRGGGYGNTVTEERWKGFKDTLEKAQSEFERAWALDQTNVEAPIQMITVCMGLSSPRETMEKWFERAMAIAPNSYEAVEAKEWLGSAEEVIAFGRECVASKKWGGNVPLILQEIHHSLQNYYNAPEAKYFSSPEVWRDVSSSYERYFELHPNNVGWRFDYAFDAYRAGQYKVFLEQLPKFTTGTNYTFFGGKEKFDEMVQTAMAKAK